MCTTPRNCPRHFISALVVTEHKMRALLSSVHEGSITNDEFVPFISTSKNKEKLRLTHLEYYVKISQAKTRHPSIHSREVQYKS